MKPRERAICLWIIAMASLLTTWQAVELLAYGEVRSNPVDNVVFMIFGILLVAAYLLGRNDKRNR